MRGGVDLVSASKVYPSSGTCVGCHTISRSGHSLATAVDDGSAVSFQLEAIDLASGQPVIAASPSRPMGWAAYSPDGSQLVVANNGVLTRYNASTGASLGTVPLPAMRYATHPDWSPDGRSLAVALTAQTPTSMEVRAASIAVLPYNTNGTWGAPVMVVMGSNSNNNYFPRWSPDGTMLAFVHATGPSRGAASAELMLVSLPGGVPQALVTANRRVGGEERIDLANTMPSWAPRVGPRLWLAFSSARPYGNVVSGGPSQLWITSLDLTSTGDPSTPAFWLPCQDVTVLNSNPVWWWNQATTL
jgi:Tol biopolymer transport system component